MKVCVCVCAVLLCVCTIACMCASVLLSERACLPLCVLAFVHAHDCVRVCVHVLPVCAHAYD